MVCLLKTQILRLVLVQILAKRFWKLMILVFIVGVHFQWSFVLLAGSILNIMSYELTIFYKKTKKSLFYQSAIAVKFKFEMLFYGCFISFILFLTFLFSFLLFFFLVGEFSVGFLLFTIGFCNLFVASLISVCFLIHKYKKASLEYFDGKLSINLFLQLKEEQITVTVEESKKTIFFHLNDVKRAKEFKKLIVVELESEKNKGIIMFPNTQSMKSIFKDII